MIGLLKNRDRTKTGTRSKKPDRSSVRQGETTKNATPDRTKDASAVTATHKVPASSPKQQNKLGVGKSAQARNVNRAGSGEEHQKNQEKEASAGGSRSVATSNTDLERLRKSNARVLTAPGGKIGVDDETRRHLAFLSDGTLVINRDSPLHSRIETFRSTVGSRNDVSIRRELRANLGFIRELYEREHKRKQKEDASLGAVTRNHDQYYFREWFKNIVFDAHDRGSSDVHVLVFRYEARLRMRIDGDMQTIRQIPAADAEKLLHAAFNASTVSPPNYNPNQYQETRITSEKLDLPESVQALRCQFNPLAGNGRFLVVRLLDQQIDAADTDVDVLGYTDTHVRALRKLRRKPYGINLIAGPTGSGKSTTLQKSLTALAREKKHTKSILTIEDPPEFYIEGAAQIPIIQSQDDQNRRQAFARAISAALRSDPDILMIGEIRDYHSMNLSFEAAQTGHQVWTSVHANDALSILSRLYDMGASLYNLTDPTLVTGLISQRLLRTLCPYCKTPYNEAYERGEILEHTHEAVLRVTDGNTRGIYTANPDGCDACTNGYKGRTVAAEVIQPDEALLARFRERKTEAFRYWHDEMQGITMLEHALQKMDEGVVDPRDVETDLGDLDEFDKTRAAWVMPNLCGPSSPQCQLSDGQTDQTVVSGNQRDEKPAERPAAAE